MSDILMDGNVSNSKFEIKNTFVNPGYKFAGWKVKWGVKWLQDTPQTSWAGAYTASYNTTALKQNAATAKKAEENAKIIVPDSNGKATIDFKSWCDTTKGYVFTLQAQWEKAGPKTARFFSNGKEITGSSVKLTVDKPTLTIPGRPAAEYEKTGCTFKGWNVKRSDGRWFINTKEGWLLDSEITSTTKKYVYNPGDEYKVFDPAWGEGDLEFYAVWETPKKVEFVSDGKTVFSTTVLGDKEPLCMPSLNNKTNSVFMGWNVKRSDGKSFYSGDGWQTSSKKALALYLPGGKYYPGSDNWGEGDLTFSAVWERADKNGKLSSSQKMAPVTTYEEATARITYYLSLCNGWYWAQEGNGASSEKFKDLKTNADSGNYRANASKTQLCNETGTKHGYSNSNKDYSCHSNYFEPGGGVRLGLSQCEGFAHYMTYVLFSEQGYMRANGTKNNTITVEESDDGWKMVTGKVASDFKVHPGDVIRYNGHSVMVYKETGNDLTVVQCNSNTTKTINKTTHYTGRCKIYTTTNWTQKLVRDRLAKNGAVVFQSPLNTYREISYEYNGNALVIDAAKKTYTKAVMKNDGMQTLMAAPETKANQTFVWTVKRHKDGYWFTDNGWQSQANIDKNGYTKKTYPAGSQLDIYNNWEGRDKLTFVGAWEKTEYTVTFEYNYSGAESTTQKYTPGASLGTLPSPTRSGYTLTGWYTDKDGGTKVDKNTKVTGSATYYAHWSSEDYVTVKYINNGKSFSSENYKKGSDVKIIAAPKAERGYEFLHWSTKEKHSGPLEFFTPGEYDPGETEKKLKEDLTLYAHWDKLKAYTVTFNANGGSSVGNKTYYNGEKLGADMPADPTRSGYSFEGWYTKQDGGSKVDKNTAVTKNITYYAHWEKLSEITYTVTFNSYDRSSTKTYHKGETLGANMPADPPRSGYSFSGWYTAETGGSKVDKNTAVTKNVSYYAHWTEAPAYLNSCTKSPCLGTVTIKESCSSYSLPCNSNTDSRSATVTALKNGNTCEVDGLYKNTAGNYWYKVAGKNEYIYAARVKNFQPSPVESYVSISGYNYPTEVDSGKTFVIRGTVTPHGGITMKLTGSISDSAKHSFSKSVTTSKAYSLKGSAIDTALTFKKLDSGDCRYIINAVYTYYYCLDGKTLLSSDVSHDLVNRGFTVLAANKTASFISEGTTVKTVSLNKAKGDKLTIPGSPAAREGYVFKGWNALRSDKLWYVSGKGWQSQSSIDKNRYTKALYVAGKSFNLFDASWGNGNISFYAVWEKAASYTVSYDANGGQNAPAAQQKQAGTALKLTADVPTRDGYKFLGWAESSSASSAAYQPGGSYTRDAALKLYAVWQKVNATGKYIVPDVVNMSLPEAALLLRLSGLIPDFVGNAAEEDKFVSAQSVPAGTGLDAGSAVTLTLTDAVPANIPSITDRYEVDDSAVASWLDSTRVFMAGYRNDNVYQHEILTSDFASDDSYIDYTTEKLCQVRLTVECDPSLGVHDSVIYTTIGGSMAFSSNPGGSNTYVLYLSKGPYVMFAHPCESSSQSSNNYAAYFQVTGSGDYSVTLADIDSFPEKPAPDLVGLRYRDAVRVIAEAGYGLTTLGYALDDIVTDQRPSAGTMINRSWPIQLICGGSASICTVIEARTNTGISWTPDNEFGTPVTLDSVTGPLRTLTLSHKNEAYHGSTLQIIAYFASYATLPYSFTLDEDNDTTLLLSPGYRYYISPEDGGWATEFTMPDYDCTLEPDMLNGLTLNDPSEQTTTYFRFYSYDLADHIIEYMTDSVTSTDSVITYTLPECSLQREGYIFTGWRDPSTGSMFSPGTELTFGNTGETYSFEAVWQYYGAD